MSTLARASAWVTRDRHQRWIIAAAGAGMALTYLFGVTAVSGLSEPLVQGDARSYFAYLPSLVLDRDLDLSNQFLVLQPEEGDDVRYPFGAGARGYAANPFPVGPALLWMPGYIAGLLVDDGLRWLGVDTGPRGYGVAAALGTALFAIGLVGAAAELSRRFASQLTGPRRALAATLLVWIGTPALYYTFISPLYSHGVAWFAIAAMLWLSWVASREPESWLRWLAAGAAAGFLLGIRLQDVPLALVSLALVSTAPASRRWHALGAWLGGAFVGYLPQAYAWFSIHGEWIPRQNLGNPAPFAGGRLGAVLFSTGYEGWLSWTPLAALAVAGLAAKAGWSRSRTARRVALGALCAIAGVVFIDVIHPYGQGAAFGARRYVSATPLLIFGTSHLLGLGRAGSAASVAAWIGVVGMAAWNLWLLAAYELLILRHGIYGSLSDVWRYAFGGGAG